MSVQVKRGDTHDITLTVNADLTGATTRLLARGPDATVAVLAHTITDAVGGVVTHTLTGLLTAGIYYLELEITRAGKITTAPTVGYLILEVAPDLA